ncbi:putative disease resistance protein RGA3 [Dioscorea cayenensis subsp. rotundata]|uniref:Disease resistance protein RGA3 n=1 Tax=Dioscorea cayennensis subsp. rotundata TaxID=55577 RepID=A0AB40CN68_DIOCR|nr:putative disease resistance protein RGA3 [Dioscorea cayenensis subsp. rotundata]XP_039141492.1 putative disease resistance protein RGA3 [Dioscorea cayenensis subsp. rotundata]XP_039141493.1 putative disease resistance protein RGA3 [Dioscorea cayenensis subsp. rotundata]XP_039141494.1 putative disease resistance protein RGA3 [Dioscorea cayenensis subsp. rotundata]XP_039141495.1 putative disease resistance protein RGA3 [Dioscorea cayenensis subsp. rotundata]XP_039141496.1 putative disease res
MAMIVDAFAGKLVERLTNVIEEKAIMVLGVKDDLQTLRRRMERIARVLKDAEKRRIQEETIKGWVDELKDLMYDADDIIDLCMIQGTGLLQDVDHHSQLAESSATASTRVRCNFPLFSCVRSVPFRYEIADKIKTLNDTLNEISEDKNKFNFSTSSISNDAYVTNEAPYLESSFLPESDIVGWDIIDATKSLVDLLVYQHEQKCRLFAIVGMGGIGKTTHAQLIYNDSKINDDFVLQSWICVSKFYTSRANLLKELIRNVGGTCGESTTIAELQKILCDVLHRKSLFLVLDDVWDADVWINLMKNPIERATTKCRVLVTTRDRNIAIKMGAIHIHNVNKLPLNFGWELLSKKVFTNNNERDILRMKDIGMQIVEKCDGLPVALKAIAGVLITKDQNKRAWEDVLNSNAWTITGLPEEIRGALYLSYESLPSALKHCFLYCSLYPLDQELYYDDLVCQWIAEGYIQASDNASLEDVAKGYYKELICRSFLQPDPTHATIYKCTMHDLLRALAQFFAGDESFSGNPQEAQHTISMQKLRHLTITSNRESVSIPHLDRLRTLQLREPPSLNTCVVLKLKHLRVLVLNGDKIENMPDSIGDLVHLRLLNLEHTCIDNLPDSLGNLINLQFLLLGNCMSLHILPNSITKLYNLRWLRLYHSPLNYVPKGIGKLEHLHHVQGLIIGDSGDNGEKGCNLEDLQMLEKLSYLSVRNLEKSSSKSSSVLSSKTHLRKLRLRCTPNTNGHIQQQEIDKIVQVFDDLCPPPCLEDLSIRDFLGGRYPKWMSSTSINTALQELIYLQLINCSNWPRLPQLGQLPQLKYLKIEGATAVVSIGPEFLGNHNGEPTESSFPKLEYLLFHNLINWVEWSLTSGEKDNEPEPSKPLMFFPHLKSISISDCPMLKALPRGLNLANIQELQIIGAHNLSRISHFSSLKELEVDDCPMLVCVEKLESLQSLKVIDRPKNNTSLPQWLISFFQQREEKPHNDQFILHLECSAQVLHDCLQGQRYWSFLEQVPRFTAYAKRQHMYLKYTKEPYYYETNIIDH